jgi:exodeoxyribonuclease VII large subunit
MGLLWIEGEVTQVSQPASGHVYFALRDQSAVVPAVMWGRDATRLPFRLEPGQRVRVRGRVGVYERDGKMQLYVDFAEPAGVGAEALALQQLKLKLAAEGIFSQERKRPLPRFPRRIGVVTSRTGAAIHDIIRTVQRRLPTPILIADAAVQGASAPHQLVQGMAMVVRAGVDVVIIGRGGGAATDLTAFNHERVVRTIARCPVPVISAVGHEIDLSLADLAADARASTPTAAAELAVPDGHVIFDQIAKERKRLDRELRLLIQRAHHDLDRSSVAMDVCWERWVTRAQSDLHNLAHRLAHLHPRAQIARSATTLGELTRQLVSAHPGARVARAHREVDALVGRRDQAIRDVLAERRSTLTQLAAQMSALSPLAVLDRGYAVVMRDNAIVRTASQVAAGDALVVRLARGSVDVTVKGTRDA